MRHHHMGLYVCLFLVACFIISPGNIAAEKSLNDVEKERKEVKDDLSDAEKKIADLVIEIDNLKQEMNELDSIMEANEKQMDQTEKDMEKVQQEINELESKIEERFDILKDRAKSYQENGGNVNFLDVLFDAADFNDFISRVSAIYKITDADSELIKEQQKDKRKVEGKKESLEEMKKELESKHDQLEEQKNDQEKAKKELQKKKDHLNSSVEKLEMKDKKLSDLETKLTRQTEQENKVSFAKKDGNGELGWPTDGGYVSSPMGTRWGSTHKGIDIARTDRSTSPPIYAAESGTVKSAGNINGYGNAVIIDHGDGMETLYGHMASLKVHNGEQVKRGQQIGVMGSTGHSTGIHLHFEVHKNGGLQNPIGYLNG